MKRKMEARLLEWKHRMENRKPLLVNGARQVGKTYLLREFEFGRASCRESVLL